MSNSKMLDQYNRILIKIEQVTLLETIGDEEHVLCCVVLV